MVIGLAAILTFTTVLVVQVHQQNARHQRLASASVPVIARITDCYAIASGTGITATGVVCHATFTLDHRRYRATLHGNNANHHPGDLVHAITTRADPSDLTINPRP